MNRLKYPMLTVGLWLAPILSLAAEPSTHQHRTWTDSTGKYTIQAEFVEFKDGKVRLRKENGKEVRIPIEKLSDADRELVQQQSQGKPAPENAPRELAAHRIKLEPPGPREFILDKANELAPATREQLREKCDALLTDKATPIVIVTIESMAEYGADDIRIETFARLLFDQWQVGIAKLGNQNSNTGILLLVSVGDRKSRIELGAGWEQKKNQLCQQIMNEQMIPRFKAGDFSGGISAAVESLDAMVRGHKLPAAPTPWWVYPIVTVFIGLAIFAVVSSVHPGARRWAWLFWAPVFTAIGYLLIRPTNRLTKSDGDGDGGFGGGSFGGGSSDGGGASGSW